MSKEIRIDRSRSLTEQPETGHNRWHPDIPAILSVEPGDHVVLETRDAFDGQFGPGVSLGEVAKPNLNLVHPLTGPVRVEGASPGDLLEVRILGIEPASYGYTAQVPGFGFLRDVFSDPFIVHWTLADGWATSDDLPGVRIPSAPFMGTIGLAPDAELLAAITDREEQDRQRGGAVLPPEPADAVPPLPEVAATAIRTLAPHETGGNFDIKQLSAGARLFLPVYCDGALFSAGDAHYAQGDCETCGTAIEMGATLHVEFAVHKGKARERRIRDPQFSRETYVVPPQYQAPERFFATTGISVAKDGTSMAENLTVAARNALLNMIEHLVAEYGYSQQQAYALCSVAVDLKVSQVVDIPNFVVSAVVPLEIFDSGSR